MTKINKDTRKEEFRKTILQYKAHLSILIEAWNILYPLEDYEID